MKSHPRPLMVASLMFGLAHCGSDNKGTTTGNPLQLQSSSYQQALTGQEPTVDFQFCVTQIQLSDDAESTSVEARLGLIDVSLANQSTVWGEVELPDTVTFSKMAIEIHRDPETCGGSEFSLTFRERALTRDLEFVYEFAQPQTISGGESMTLALENIVSVLEEAFDDGSLNDTDIVPFIERFVDSGEVD